MAEYYYRDVLGNMYYPLEMGGNFSGMLTKILNVDFGVSQVGGRFSDDVKKDMLAATPAHVKKWVQVYDDKTEKDITTTTLILGNGENTHTQYKCNVGGFFNVNDVTTADRFNLGIAALNLNTIQSYNSSQNVLTYDFSAATCAVVRVAMMASGEVLTLCLMFVASVSLKNGTIRLDATQIANAGAGWCSGKQYAYCYTNAENIIPDFKLKKVEQDNTPDTDEGGGYGGGTNPTDTVDIPPLPNINLNVTGSSLYVLTENEMSQFTKWLWTSDWTENIKKLRTDPMQNVISVSIIDADVRGASAPIVLGNVLSDVSASIAPRWIEVDCGTIQVDEFYGTFADYSPYVNFVLYLPKVGFVSLPPDLVVNNIIHVAYHVEVSSGEGLCYVAITNTRNGFTYIYNTYTCSCTANVVLSASDKTGQIQALINASTSLLSSAVSGATPATLASSAISGAMSVATAKNPTETRGAMGNMSSLMCHKKPYLMINATYLTKPSDYRQNNGHALHATKTLGDLSGFVQTIDFHTDFSCPSDVAGEIERLLNEGVFVN